MRRVAGLFLAVVFVLLVPPFAAADLFGLGMPWGSSWGQASSGGGSCCDPGLYGAWGPGKCCTQFFVGWEVRRDRDRRPFASTLDLTGNINGLGFQQINTDFSDPSGLWLGVSNYCQCSDNVGILITGWYLFPTGGDAQENYLTNFGNGIIQSRTWSTNISRGWIDAAFVLGSPCGLNLIAGFRWDSWNFQLKNPSPVTPVSTFAIGTPSDEADLTLNSYIPLIGTQACWGGPCCGLLVRVVGFPWVPGNLRYDVTGIAGPNTRLQVNGNYSTGHFIEVFSEYSRTCPGFGCIGIFARFNYLGVRTRTSPQILGIVPPPVVEDTEGPRGTSWTLGGKVTLNFDTPSLPRLLQ
ncbi:MAG TPA: hypothetical protein VMC85_20510 [Desulfomonilaceae bacterium]|nr:hypothetical protein [Desulfomonilaceae bacterium]HVN81683.1 hypothetical protein [Terriglobia bacterium]